MSTPQCNRHSIDAELEPHTSNLLNPADPLRLLKSKNKNGLPIRPVRYGVPHSLGITFLRRARHNPHRIRSLSKTPGGLLFPVQRSPHIILDNDTLRLYYRVVVSYDRN